MADENREIHVDADRARAGATPHMTRYVLSISLVLIIMAMIVILAFFYA